MTKPKLAISFSGGRSSAVMTRLCLDEYGDSHEIVVTFANTGCEHPATLDFVRDCDRYWGFNTVWLEAVVFHGEKVSNGHKVVSYETASRNGEPFEEIIKKYGMPNPTAKFCTSRLKADVMESYLKSIGWIQGKNINYQTAIGIRADEIDRMSAESDKRGIIYPLIDKGITKSKVNSIMADVPWDLKLPNDALGNCVWCWKKSNRKLYTLAKTHPWVFDFPLEMERKYGCHMTHYEDGTPYAAIGPDGRRHFYRQHRDAATILEEARNKVGMVLYTDQIQSSIFDELLDLGGACSESCEIDHE